MIFCGRALDDSRYQPNSECKKLNFIKQNLGAKVLIQKEKSPTLQLKAEIILKFKKKISSTGEVGFKAVTL